MSQERAPERAEIRCPVSHGFDLLDPDQVKEPYGLLAVARRETPVFYEPKMDLWCLTLAEDVLESLKDTERFSNSHEEVGRPPEEVAKDLPMGHPVAQSLDTLDPPQHTRIRKLVQRSFTPRAVARWEDDIRSICEGLIDRFVDCGQVDLMSDYAMLFPSQVIAGVLGMPRTDAPALKDWTDDWFQIWLGDDPPEVRLERWRRAIEFDSFIRRFVENRRAEPQDDLTSMMIHAKSEDGEPSLSDWEVICVIAGIVAAGSDTTSMLIGEATYQLLSHPDTWARVKADRSLIPQVLEETLRLRNVVRSTRRVTTCPVDIAETEIPAGSALWVGLASFNHDESVFDRPDEFDIDRKDLGAHLGFGKWTHFCLGAPLARLEGRVAMECLIDRIPGLRLGDRDRDGLSYVPNAIVPVIRGLDVLWD
jgi:cytochrome P450